MATPEEDSFRRVLMRLYAAALAGDMLAARVLLAAYCGDEDAVAEIARLAIGEDSRDHA
jgi:hypothetical protein